MINSLTINNNKFKNVLRDALLNAFALSPFLLIGHCMDVHRHGKLMEHHIERQQEFSFDWVQLYTKNYLMSNGKVV
jgi:hypothetical protein